VDISGFLEKHLITLDNIIKLHYTSSMKTFKIYPNKNTISMLNAWFGQTHFVWNYYLNKRTLAYKEENKSLSYAKYSQRPHYA